MSNPIPSPIVRDDFLLDPTVIYLNHGSFGATPRPVFDSYQRWQRELEAQPTEFLGRRAPGLLAASRAILADYLSAPPDNLAYVTNATVGLNIAARCLTLGAGDEVLATNHEYGALDRTWHFLAKKQGFTYINQPIPVPVTTPQALVDALWQGVTPRTRVIFFSHITSPTALIFPAEAICQRARAQGIVTIVDGAHASGQIPLALGTLGADFYSGNLHKWLCAPKGAAFLYARAEMLAQIEPLIVSWGYESDAPTSSRLVDYVEWQGTRDIAAFLAVPDAIAYQQAHDWPAVRRECQALVSHTLREIAALSGQPCLSPYDQGWYCQMAGAPLPPGVDTAALHQRLYEKARVEIPILDWHGYKLARCSFQAYNTLADADALVAALRQNLSGM